MKDSSRGKIINCIGVQNQSSAPRLAQATSAEVCKVVSEINRWKRNVVVTGFPEVETSADECEIKQLEELMFTSFCEEHLTVKPLVSYLG